MTIQRISISFPSRFPIVEADDTCLSFKPKSKTSSISVNFGCLFLSSLSLISRGSKAILCPFSPPVYDVSGVRSVDFGAGEESLLGSLSSFPGADVPPPPPPRRRVNPPEDSICTQQSKCDFGDCRVTIEGRGTLRCGWRSGLRT